MVFFISDTSVILLDGPNPSGWDGMRKQFVCLAVICVIAVAAFVSISIYREDVRSDLVPLNDSLDGGLFGKVGATIDGEPYEIAELYSQISPVYSDGDRTYCELLMIVTSNAEGRPSFTLYYSYFSDSDSLVPEDAQALADEGSYRVFEYTDDLSGDIIRFYVSDERIRTVDVVGSSVLKVGDGFKPLDYDMSVDYGGTVTSVNRVMEMDPTPTKVYRIEGHENGERLEGTITVRSISSKIFHGQINEYAEVSIGIEGTELPGFITKFYSSLGEDGSFYNSNASRDIYRDGVYVESDSSVTVEVDDGWEVVMEGVVTYYQLDEDLGIVSERTIEFGYEVI